HREVGFVATVGPALHQPPDGDGDDPAEDRCDHGQQHGLRNTHTSNRNDTGTPPDTGSTAFPARHTAFLGCWSVVHPLFARNGRLRDGPARTNRPRHRSATGSVRFRGTVTWRPGWRPLPHR